MEKGTTVTADPARSPLPQKRRLYRDLQAKLNWGCLYFVSRSSYEEGAEILPKLYPFNRSCCLSRKRSTSSNRKNNRRPTRTVLIPILRYR